MKISHQNHYLKIVVPHVGTWIEIAMTVPFVLGSALSFPTWERGLKSVAAGTVERGWAVVPHVGTWIEIVANANIVVTREVVPHVGTWIEIF